MFILIQFFLLALLHESSFWLADLFGTPWWSASFCAVDKTPPGFPQINKDASQRVVEVGHAVIIPCKAIGNPIPTIYWIKNQTKVDISNPRYSIKEGKCVTTIIKNGRAKKRAGGVYFYLNPITMRENSKMAPKSEHRLYRFLFYN